MLDKNPDTRISIPELKVTEQKAAVWSWVICCVSQQIFLNDSCLTVVLPTWTGLASGRGGCGGGARTWLRCRGSLNVERSFRAWCNVLVPAEPCANTESVFGGRLQTHVVRFPSHCFHGTVCPCVGDSPYYQILLLRPWNKSEFGCSGLTLTHEQKHLCYWRMNELLSWLQ